MARSVRINLTIPPDIAERFERIAKKEKRTFSNMTAIALEKYCDLYETEEQTKEEATTE